MPNKFVFWTEKIKHPMCSIHNESTEKPSIAYYRIIAENRQTLFLCEKCYKDVKSGKQKFGNDDNEIIIKEKINDMCEEYTEIRTKSVVAVHQQKLWSEFGKEKKSDYLRYRRKEFISGEIWLAGYPKRYIKISGENFRFSEDNLDLFIFSEDANYFELRIIQNKKTGENTYCNSLKFPQTFWSNLDE